MLEGHNFKGYLPGGASGGILPSTLNNIPLDYEIKELDDLGCFLGSAAVVILSDKDNIMEVGLNLLKFFEDESCGQCTPCRVGTEKTVKLMQNKKWNKKQLEEHLENFTTDRAAGKQKTDINRGVSWTDEGKSYFKFKDFWKYLQNTRSWTMERNKTLHKIEELFDAKIDDSLNIAGKTVKVVSINAFTAEKGKDEPPPIERPPFVK